MTQNEQQYTSDGVRFEFEVVAAYSVYPNSGPTAGGTLVEVRGAGIELPDARGLFCQFGGVDPVAATHASRELVLCAVPPSAGGSIGAVPVRLLNNDAVYGSVVAYTYRAIVSVDRVHPVAGARGGGTLVTVYGAGFIGTTATSCRFGEVAVPARLSDGWAARVHVAASGGGGLRVGGGEHQRPGLTVRRACTSSTSSRWPCARSSRAAGRSRAARSST